MALDLGRASKGMVNIEARLLMIGLKTMKFQVFPNGLDFARALDTVKAVWISQTREFMGHLRKNMIYPVMLICAVVAASKVWASDLDCSKFSTELCSVVNNLKANTDTLSIVVTFLPPPSDSFCYTEAARYDTTGRCAKTDFDSAYAAQLKSDVENLFTTHELFDSYHPQVRLQVPEKLNWGYGGILVTKETFLEIAAENYITTLSLWFHPRPAANKAMVHVKQGRGSPGPGPVLINGRRIGPAHRMPFFANKVGQE